MPRMNTRRSAAHQLAQDNLFKIVLVALLLFALFHTSQHQLVDDAHELGTCQVCRLAHMPVGTSADVVIFEPQLYVVARLEDYLAPVFTFFRTFTHHARAPPAI